MPMYSRILRNILFILTFFITLITNAADKISLQHMSYAKLSENFAIQFDSLKPLATQKNTNTLKFIKQRTDENNVQHIRLQQYYLGIPILGGDAIIHKKNYSIQKVSGTIYQKLYADLGSNPPYSEQLANEVLRNFIQPWQAKHIVEKKISPIIFIDKNAKANWAYQVELSVLLDDTMPKKPAAIIDVYTKDKFIAWDNIKTSRTPAHGLGFGGNQKTGLIKYGHDLPFLNISHDDSLGVCYMENAEIKIVDMQNLYIADDLPMASNCPYSAADSAYWTGYDEDGYDKINGAYSISNDALYIAEIIKSMYRKTYKVEPLTDRGKPQQLIMRVHYGRNYANAFWDGEQMSFGDGDYFIYPLVALSIGAHEISHGFTEQHSNLVYFGQSGAINESFSDMAAQAAEYYVTKKNTWKIGHEILKNTSQMDAIRFMDNPSLDKHSIEFAHHYRDGMDVHYSSGVFNKLFYLLATTPKWNTRKAFKVMLKANMDYWTPTANFSDAACGIIYAAKDLKYSTIDVKNALDEVIIDYDNC